MRKIYLVIIAMILFNFASMTFVSALSIVTHVPEKYTNVVAGERFYFDIEIKYPENPSRKDLILNYEILKDNEIVAQAKVLKAVETQASFIDFIVIPESAEKGLYVINVKISDYESLNKEVEASFYVTSGSSEQIQLYFFILLGAVVLVGILVMVNIFIKKRKNS